MAITFDPAKSHGTLSERGIDYVAAEPVFARSTHQFEDRRTDYDDTHHLTVGLLNRRMVIVGWTPRGIDRHVLTMRKANAREQALSSPLLRRCVRRNRLREGGCPRHPASEYDEIPELTDEMMARADFYVGNVLVRRGRSDAVEADAFRLSPAILAHFRKSGTGWQARIDAILRDAIDREKLSG